MASDSLKRIVHYSMPFFFALAIAAFLLIFLVAAGIGNKSQNWIDNETPIQQDQFNVWGQVPGKLNYNMTARLNLYSFNAESTSTDDVIMTKLDDMDYDIARDFADTTWYQQKSVISYGLDSQYVEDVLPDSNAAVNVQYPNLGSLDVWYQMSSKPKYQLAWQALAQSSTVMFGSDNLFYRFYAQQSYQYMFSNRDDVNAYVFAGVIDDSTQQDLLYTDEYFGLGNLDGLVRWCGMSDQSVSGVLTETSTQYKAIVAHFTAQGLTLTSEQMNTLAGKGSMLFYLVTTLNSEILEYSEAGADYADQIAAQWGGDTIIYQLQLKGSSMPTIYSVADLVPYLSTAPEFGAWLIDVNLGNKGAGLALNNSQSLSMYKQDLSSYNTLLNVQNVRYLYMQYAQKKYQNIMTRFVFNSTEQVDAFMEYCDYMIDTFLFQGTNEEITAMGSLLSKQTNATFTYLQTTLPVTLASRVLVSEIAVAGDSCIDYVAVAVSDTDQQAAICAQVDLTNPNSIQFFTNATWYGEPYYTEFLTASGMTAAEFTAFWDATNTASFGYIYTQSLADISTQFGCADAANCTSTELATQQWGSGSITSNPASAWSSTLLPKQDSVKAWGDASWLPYNDLTMSPEYSSYKRTGDNIDTDVATLMMNNDFLTYGLQQKLICQNLVQAILTNNADAMAAFTDFYTMSDPSKLNLADFFFNVRYDMQTRFFGDAYTIQDANEYIFGFTNSAADMINGGDFYNGDDFSLSNTTSPIFHDKIGNQAATEYGMYTGSNKLSNIGNLRIVNGQAYVNRLDTVWNGNMYVNQTLNRDLTGESSSQLRLNTFSQVSFGMQYPPGQDQTSIKNYNQRNILVDEYIYDNEFTVGDDKLSIYKFTANNWSGDIGFSTNLNLYEESYGCYGCDWSKATKQVMVDGKPLVPTLTQSDNFVSLEPRSGYMMQQKKESTVYYVLGGMGATVPESGIVATPFPDLDPLYGVQVPLFDIQENLEASTSKLSSRLQPVASANSDTKVTIITLSVFAALFLVLGIVALVMHKLMGGADKVNRDELLERHMVDNQ